MAGRTDFPQIIRFPLLFMMLVKLENLWHDQFMEHQINS